MAQLEDWRTAARAHSGSIVVWINQSAAANLKAVNSNGVCKAITMDWIASYRKYRSDRAAFVNQFRKYDADGNLETCIPDTYLAKQTAFTQQLALDRKAYVAAIGKYKLNPTLAGKKKVDDILRRARGGPDCRNFTKFTSIDQVATALTSLAKPAYCALALTEPGGHVIGFELRSDQKVSDNFPKLYEYLDANTGLFAFGDLQKMLDFVKQKVWPQRADKDGKVVWNGYAKKYTKFMLLEYDIGLGGFGLSPQEEQAAIDKELAELEAEFEQQFGKDWWKADQPPRK
jgi:hypothetical protein